MKNNKLVKVLILLGILVVLAVNIIVFRKIAELVKDPDQFRAWIDSYGIYSPLIYMLVTIIQILIPFIPGEPMEMVAGYSFSAVKGTIYCLLAESIGSFIVLFLTRKYGRKLVEVFFDEEKIESLSFLRSSKKRLILYSIIFIMPGTPKDLLCYFAGLTDMDLKSLMLVVSLGRIPSIITSTIAGDFAGDKSYRATIITIAITSLLSLAGLLTYRYIKTKNDAE